MNPEVWLPAAPAGAAKPASRLLVLPHAGSGTAAWFGWRARIPGDVELRVARLPGREVRLSEPPLTSAVEVVAALVEAVRALPPLPLVVFGHSLGALLAYGACTRLRGAVRALVVSGQTAPSIARSHDHLLGLPDRELADAVNRRWRAVPTEILANPQLLSIFLPALRADLTLVGSFPTHRDARLDIPLFVFAGIDDDLDDRGLQRWADHTSGTTYLVRHAGGHMAVLENPAVAEQILYTCQGGHS